MWKAMAENLSWKLFSLALAGLLWYTVANDDVVSMSIHAPIQYRSLASSLEFGSDIPDTVRLEVTGPSRKLTNAILTNAVVSIDLAQVKTTGVQSFNVSRSILRLPPGVTLTRAVPSQIRLYLEERATKEISVRPNCVGKLPEGLELKSCESIPPTLIVTGPKSHVEKIREAITVPVDLSQIRGNISQQVYSIIEEPQVRFADKSAVSVKVTVSGSAGASK